MATIATLYKSGEVEGNSAYTHHPGGMFIRKTVYTSPAFAVNDVVQLVDVFAGECLHAVILETTDIDTNGSPAIVLDLGYGNSDTETAATSDDIIDGSTIVVGKQKEVEPFDRTEFAKELTSIVANLAQAIAVVVVAVR